MNRLRPLIDAYKIACGKVDRKTLTLSHKLYDGHRCSPKTGHLYFGEFRTFLLWVDSNCSRN